MIGIGRLYTVVFEAVSCTVQQTLFYVKPAADKICILEGVYISNAGGTADAGDAQEELYDIVMNRMPATVTVGSGGTAPTPQPVATNDAAAGFTARVNDTTKATTSGTASIMHSDGFNVRIPYVWLPPPEHRHLVGNAQAWICNLNTTPNDAILLNGTALVREIP